MKQYYIYKTTNLCNNKQYIGKHYGEINDNYLGSGILLKKAIQKYGIDNFYKEILDFSESEEENREKEKFYINYYNAINSPYFYNIADGGQGGNTIAGYTLKQKQERNKKISEGLKRHNHPLHGHHHSEETKEKIRQKALEYWTEEKRAIRSLQYSGKNHPMYGKKKSLESIQKQILHTDRSYMKTQEYRNKMSLATRGEKNGNYGNKDEKAKNGKCVKMWSLTGELIQTFPTVRMSLKFLGITGHSGLDNAIKKHTVYHGYYWTKE